MANEGIVVLSFILILLGFYLKQLWLSFIFIMVIFALLLTRPSKKAKKAAPRGPVVRPIIVKRKYVGPESIYPEKMHVKITPRTPDDWYEVGGEYLGGFIGKSLRFIKRKLGGD